MTTALLSPASALIAHIESLVDDRRILVVGNAEHSIAEHLLDRGARLVQFLDPDARRVAHAAAHNGERRVTYAQLTDSSLRDGSFELAIVEDAGLTDNLDKLVSGLRRSMNNRGLALICTTNAESSTGLLGVGTGKVDYDLLAETTEDLFESVIMLGQSPFLGYSVVQFDLDHPPEPALDNAYLNQEGETPDFYIALCGSAEAMAEVNLEDMSIVQLPAARFVQNSEQIQREKERRAARKVESLENELKAEKARGSDKEVERLTRELEQRDTWIKKLESRAESADARADDADNELEEVEKELEATHKELIKARKESKKAKERAASIKEAEKESADFKKEAADLKKESADFKKEAADFKKEAADLKKEAADLKKEAADLKKDAASHKKEVKKLKSDLEKAEERADEAKHHSAAREALEEEVDELHEENEKLTKNLKDKARAQEKLQKRLSESEKEIDELHEQLDETEDLFLAEKKKASQASTSEEAEEDLRRLERQLQERGSRISELEGQLRKLETYAKTLTAELQSSGSSESGADQAQVDALAKALAEREADLVAAQWTIGQLKQSSVKD